MGIYLKVKLSHMFDWGRCKGLCVFNGNFFGKFERLTFKWCHLFNTYVTVTGSTKDF